MPEIGEAQTLSSIDAYINTHLIQSLTQKQNSRSFPLAPYHPPTHSLKPVPAPAPALVVAVIPVPDPPCQVMRQLGCFGLRTKHGALRVVFLPLLPMLVLVLAVAARARPEHRWNRRKSATRALLPPVCVVRSPSPSEPTHRSKGSLCDGE